MLNIPLQTLSREPLDRDGDVRVDVEPWLSTDLEFDRLPHVELRIQEVGEAGIHVTGQIRTAVVLECRRCLGPVREALALNVDWLFDPGATEDGEEEGVFVLDETSDVLDLTPQVREEILLAAPPYPVCDADCRGLCVKCGANLNETTCGCRTAEPDPRWGPLREMTSS